MTRCTPDLPFKRRYGSETHQHLGVQPPVIFPSCVGPGGPSAGLEPADATVDAVEVVGVVVAEEVLETLEWTGVREASVTVGEADPAE